jgi:hypothetical protein
VNIQNLMGSPSSFCKFFILPQATSIVRTNTVTTEAFVLLLTWKSWSPGTEIAIIPNGDQQSARLKTVEGTTDGRLERCEILTIEGGADLRRNMIEPEISQIRPEELEIHQREKNQKSGAPAGFTV